MQRVDVLILARQIHCPDSNLMHIGVLKHCLPLFASKILVEDCNCKEVGPCRAFERRSHFDHPIYHLGAVLFAHVVSVQRRGSVCLVPGDQVLVDLSEQRQLEVFFLLWSRLLSAQPQAFVSLLLSTY